MAREDGDLGFPKTRPKDARGDFGRCVRCGQPYKCGPSVIELLEERPQVCNDCFWDLCSLVRKWFERFQKRKKRD